MSIQGIPIWERHLPWEGMLCRGNATSLDSCEKKQEHMLHRVVDVSCKVFPTTLVDQFSF